MRAHAPGLSVVLLEASAYESPLIYRPEGFVLGMVIAAIALAAGVGVWVRRPSPTRR